MKIVIRKEVFQKFHPQFKVAFILAEKIDNKGKVKEAQELLKEISEMNKLIFNKESVKSHHLISPWVTLQERFKEKAKHYHTSVERLLKKVLGRRKVTTGDTLTNLIRFVSLKEMVPMGVDDADKIKGEIEFRVAKGTERGTALRKVKKGALYYQDGKRVLGTKLDYWQAKGVKPGKKTSRWLIHIEALPPIDGKKLKEVVKEMEELVKGFCGGKVKKVVLGKRKREGKV